MFFQPYPDFWRKEMTFITHKSPPLYSLSSQFYVNWLCNVIGPLIVHFDHFISLFVYLHNYIQLLYKQIIHQVATDHSQRVDCQSSLSSQTNNLPLISHLRHVRRTRGSPAVHRPLDRSCLFSGSKS
jgi:hypothetical protein